jgi:two-component system, OmpR family, sensor kinase
VSRDSFTRSAGRATSSGLRAALGRIPIRWKLAGGSALLTLTILCGFAVAVGALTAQRIHDDFEQDVKEAADKLYQSTRVTRKDTFDATEFNFTFRPNLQAVVGGDGTARLITLSGKVLRSSRGAPNLGSPVVPTVGGPEVPRTIDIRGYRVENRVIRVSELPPLVLQYARPKDSIEATVQRVRLFLVGGVIGGAGLALLAGLMIARRAMSPIMSLTDAAREIEQTRDPDRRIDLTGLPDDEVTDLARTLDGMLQALSAARGEQDAMLRRQREFVADASHELRTPLTSVLANLDFLAETLDGEQGDAARSALRSSHRMRRLVQDLLLLARADARRVTPHEPLDVADVLVEAASELEPVTEGHEISVDAQHAYVEGARDELHRLVLNLMENAVKHTPDGTHIRASVARDDRVVRLTVADDGPGIPAELRDRVFERFVRGSGDRGGSFGLGLSIVRAVAESHGGSVELQSPNGHGTTFVVTLPSAEAAAPRT